MVIDHATGAEETERLCIVVCGNPSVYVSVCTLCALMPVCVCVCRCLGEHVFVCVCAQSWETGRGH